mmetsp:Transcript_26158/g.66426  ORF Transcript_26158/g.66426 Transcript_26158/m.66426 type:complete len:279 (-) Transcript_26158:2264-3100(-)
MRRTRSVCTPSTLRAAHGVHKRRGRRCSVVVEALAAAVRRALLVSWLLLLGLEWSDVRTRQQGHHSVARHWSGLKLSSLPWGCEQLCERSCGLLWEHRCVWGRGGTLAHGRRAVADGHVRWQLPLERQGRGIATIRPRRHTTAPKASVCPTVVWRAPGAIASLRLRVRRLSARGHLRVRSKPPNASHEVLRLLLACLGHPHIGTVTPTPPFGALVVVIVPDILFLLYTGSLPIGAVARAVLLAAAFCFRRLRGNLVGEPPPRCAAPLVLVGKFVDLCE